MDLSPPQLDGLAQLNRHLAALVRAGVPVEKALGDLSGSLPVALQNLTGRLEQRLKRGERLADALAKESRSFSPMYAAVVEAGIASGRLPEALESLAEAGVQLKATSQATSRAVVYPIVIATCAYALFCFQIAMFIPSWESTFESMRLAPNWGMRLLIMLHNSIATWVAIPPVLAGFAFALSLGRNSIGGVERGLGWVSRCLWIPGVKPVFDQLGIALFSQRLGMLVEHGVPLPESLDMVGASFPNSRLGTASAEAASRLARGDSLPHALEGASVLPPLLRWMLTSGERLGQLGPSLGEASKLYQRNVERRLVWLSMFLPSLAVIVIGLSAVLMYALAVFFPLLTILSEMNVEVLN